MRKRACIPLALSVFCLLWPAGYSAAAAKPKLLEVLTPVNDVNWVLPMGRKVWFATGGGVKVLDRKTDRWSFYTRYDGLAANRTTQLASRDGDILAFHIYADSYSILKKGTGRWQACPLGGPGRPEYGHTTRTNFVVLEDSLWCIYRNQVGDGLSSPAAFELHQYGREPARLLRRIDIYELAGLQDAKKHMVERLYLWPAGLVNDGRALWLHLADNLFRVDPHSGATVKFSLPQAVRSLDAPSLNRIAAVAVGEKCLWLALERGLVRFDTVRNEFEVLPGTQGLRHRAFGLVCRGRRLWSSSDVKAGGLRRYDTQSGKLATFANANARWPKHFAVTNDEAWLAHGGPAGVGHLDLKTGKWRSFQHTAFYGYGVQVVIVADHACAWNTIYPDRPQHHETGWLEDYDLKTGKISVHQTGRVGLMIPHGREIYLVSVPTTVAYSPSSGEFRKTCTLQLGWGLSSLEILARRGRQLWLHGRFYQKNAYGEFVFTFDLDKGRLEKVLQVPEAWRCRNSGIPFVSDKYVYLEFIDDGSIRRVMRYDLASKKWSELELGNLLKDYRFVVFALGRLWIAKRDKLHYVVEGQENHVGTYGLPGQFICLLEAIDGEVRVTTTKHLIRYNGKSWQYRPITQPSEEIRWAKIITGLDAAGKPMNRFALLRYGWESELAIYDGRLDQLVPPAHFREVQPQSDGTIVLPADKP
ncbi:MAG: hypothetical protein ACYTF6_06400 [Planctomycetota bacterium]|jgi:hypothetical protein